MAFAEEGCCEQVLCHNKIMAVDKGGLLGDTYPYPPITSRRPEVAPNLEVVAFATTLDYTHTLGICEQKAPKPLKCSMFERLSMLLHMQLLWNYTHTLGLCAPLTASHSQGRGERGGSRSVGGGGTPPWLSRGAETGGG